ncbi:type II toxin-antitoxin system VapC family toxin [Bradyrhizobium iriomotense]|uniref:type II toxin-antitoxin system VapC family toxin n=1 Tax=Bradyrhizobium iriomotense TaxID=441950 RepID=UPI001B8A0636|nr:type II toxin-antitoxin system VapC family toxin [Bradyrhizobium iriomotense]MBR1127769.1 type II toxin-antitoxin system VapC family toxin [Bradyrhizobium iriomotense]
MVLDTSAIIATVTNELDAQRYRTAMLDADSLSMSAVAVLEAKIVLSARFGATAVAFFDELLETAGIVVVPFDADMANFSGLARAGDIRHNSTSSIVRSTLSPKCVRNRSSSKESILPRRISSRRWSDRAVSRRRASTAKCARHFLECVAGAVGTALARLCPPYGTFCYAITRCGKSSAICTAFSAAPLSS